MSRKGWRSNQRLDVGIVAQRQRLQGLLDPYATKVNLCRPADARPS